MVTISSEYNKLLTSNTNITEMESLYNFRLYSKYEWNEINIKESRIITIFLTISFSNIVYLYALQNYVILVFLNMGKFNIFVKNLIMVILFYHILLINS